MPSLFGALNTAVSGLTAQSAAFGNISDNVANSQTAGFKRTDTSFADYLATSTAVTNDSGFVVARPEYQNSLQGTIAASGDPLALAVGGQGFFQVQQQAGSGSSATLSSVAEYTRDGDFTLDKNGHLINGSQQVLTGWLANSSGTLDKTQQVAIKVDQSALAPVQTSAISLAANLPAVTYASASPDTETAAVNIYDAKGNLQTVTLTYTQTAADTWSLALNAPGATTPALGTATLVFGPTASGTAAPAGTLGSITDTTGSTTAYAAGTSTAARVTFNADFGSGTQAVTLNLGSMGSATGLTQYAGTAYQPHSLTQDGATAGNYTGTTTQSNGDILNVYDNGRSKLVARVPLAQFANANALQRQNGQGYVVTDESGTALVRDVSSSGATLATGSVEGSNVDIAAEFTKLIVAQQAYAANSKVVVTANEMLTQTIDMKR